MGGGASNFKCGARSDDEINILESEEMLKLIDVDPSNKLDNFAREMFLRSPKVEGLHHVLSSHSGREAFMKFLRSE